MRRAVAYLSCDVNPNRGSPLHAVLGGMFSLVRDFTGGGILVAACCRVLGFSWRAFYI